MINDILYNRVSHFPNKNFINYEGNNYNYQKFNNIVESIAIFIDNQYQNTFLNININDKLLLFASLIACNRVDKVPVLVSVLNNHLVDIDDEIIQKVKICSSEHYKSKRYNGNDTQAVVFSSGTTDKPKGCELTYNNFYYNSLIWNENFNFTQNDIYINILPINHVGGLCIMFRALYNNFSVRIADYSLHYLSTLNKTHFSFISLVPAMLYDIINNSLESNFRNTKKIIIGGSKINAHLIKESLNCRLSLHAVYGMTETCSGIAGSDINMCNYKKIRYMPFSNVHIDVNKSKIFITSDTIMKKYYKQSIEFKNFEANDYGTLFSDGSFTVNGRSDTTIISGGENFSKTLIEDHINNIPDIIRSRVIGVEDEKWGQKIIAFIETENKFIDMNNILPLLESKIAKK